MFLLIVPQVHTIDTIMSEANESSSKRKVMVTGGTGLVGHGIKEFVSTDAEVNFLIVSKFATVH